ncbi:hypothetical protein BC830DRAFT_711282 [Chytriomyces sp. MP71]|nr:hypothetical protein BC830DRAFT_711282 [Chytriomyces sp. MP71]
MLTAIVSWKGRKLEIAFRADERLADLVERCSAATGVPCERIKLLASGVMMRDPSASLSHYGLKDGSKIMMMGDAGPTPTGPRPTALPKPSTPPQTPESLAQQKLSDAEMTLTSTLLPEIVAYEAAALAYTQDPAQSHDVSTAKKLRDIHARLGEAVLQTLLKVDGVVVPDGQDEIRARRKEAVKRCNGMLDRLDGTKESIREFESRVKGSSGGNGEQQNKM